MARRAVSGQAYGLRGEVPGCAHFFQPLARPWSTQATCADSPRQACRYTLGRAPSVSELRPPHPPISSNNRRRSQAPELRSFALLVRVSIFRAAFKHRSRVSTAHSSPRWEWAPAGSRHPHSQRRTLNCTAHSQAQAQPITLSPKVLVRVQVRAPPEQSKVYERLEESVAEKVNRCAAAASIITGTRR